MNWLIPLGGIFIGWFTNVIAVEMLFKPKKPLKIFKWNFPFTPGLIPKYREKIVETASEGISSVVVDTVTGEGRHKIFALFNKVISNHWFTDIFIVESKRKQLYDALIESVITEKETKNVLNAIISKQLEKYDDVAFEKTVRHLTKESLRGIKILGGIIGGVVGLITMLLGAV